MKRGKHLTLCATAGFLAAVFLGPPIAAQGQQPEQPDRTAVIRQRQEWFYNQRAYPLGHIPEGARLKALNELKGLATAQPRAIYPSAAAQPRMIPLSTTAWTLIGPEPTLPSANNPYSGYPIDAGRVTALAFDPRDTTDKTIYLGSAEGGLWVTTNSGQTWTPLMDFEPSLAVGSVALDPSTSPTTVYIGTGEENFSADAYYGAGVLKSIDGGKTWTQDSTFSQTTAASPTASGPYIGALALDPFNNQILLAGVGTSAGSSVSGGIWRSTDGAISWTIVLPEPASGNGTSVVFDPSSSGIAYAALGAFVGNLSNGVYKSTDGGVTWTALLSTTGFYGRISLAVGPPISSGKPGVLLVAIADSSSGNLLELLVSIDGGSTWARLTGAADFCAGQCWYDMAIGISPVNPSIFYIGGSNNSGGDALSISTDGGGSWSPDLYAGNGPCTSTTATGQCVNANGQLHTDTHAIAFSPDGAVLAIGNDGGVWTTTNVGATSNVLWNDLNGPLAITQFYPGISIVPGNPNSGLGGDAGQRNAELHRQLGMANQTLL